VTVRTALGSSFNIPAVKMLNQVGVPAMLQTAKDMGITTLTDTDNYGLSLTLGGGAVPMIEMMSVYNTFSQNGTRYPITGILKVTDANGVVLEDNENPEGKQALQPEVAYLITSVLSDPKARVPAFGPNSLLEIAGHPKVAVKTGTSDEKRDNWAFGYTPEYVVGTWVGNSDYSPMDQRLASGITGATPIWHDIMANLVKNRPDLAFSKPAGVVDGVVGGNKDLVISGQSGKTMAEATPLPKKEAQKDKKDGITFSDTTSLGVPPLKAR
jgi:membrane peptidoglycan carboxypeptidase